MALRSALLDQIPVAVQSRQYSRETAKAYRRWGEQYLLWLKAEHGGWRNPAECGAVEVTGFLTYLANVRNVAPSTQNQALSAVLFLHRQVLGHDIQGVDAVRAKPKQRLPSVLSTMEVSSLLQALSGTNKLIGQLLYGCGLRISEAVSLRVKDLDFNQHQITVQHGKGGKDRIVGMPRAIGESLRRQVTEVDRLHRADIRAGTCRVELPAAYHRKCPSAAASLAWYWVFPSHKLSRHPDEAGRGVITSTLAIFRGPCGLLRLKPGYTGESRLTFCGTAMRLTC